MQFATNDVELDGDVSREQLHGQEYLVAEVVAVREMVLNGGFLPFEEIQRSAPGWNGVPITLHHPEDENGNFISANLPEVHESHVLGRLFNAHADEETRGLVGQMWIHLGVAGSHGGEAEQTVDQLESQDALEVSTGYFMEPVPQPGTHEGDSYEQVQTNLLPDHLAALPGGQGACSVEDGCGAPRANTNADTTASGGVWQSVRHAGHVLVGNAQGCGCGCGGDNNTDTTDSDNDNETHIMHDRIKQFLVETAGVEAEDLDDPNDDVLEAIGEAEAAFDEGEPSDNDADADADSGLTAEEVADIVEARLDEREEARQSEERSELIDHITDHSDKWTEEMLEAVDTVEALETIADDVTPQADSGPFGGGVNYAGRGASEPTTESNGEWDDYEPVITDNVGQEEAD